MSAGGVHGSGARWLALAVALALGLMLLGRAGPAGAAHVENPRQGLEEAGFHGLDNTGFHTDIMPWVSGNGRVYAATGTWGTVLEPSQDCPSETDDPSDPEDSGVKIIDATDPANPVKVAHLGTIPGAQNNDVKVTRLPTVDGPKDILVHSLEPCGAKGVTHQIPGTPLIDVVSGILGAVEVDQTGFQVYDVSDPANPVELGTWNNGGLGTHNLYLFSQGDRSFVAAVFNEVDFVGLQNEREVTGHLQIVEITDPEQPTLVSQWNLNDAEAQGGPPEEELCLERGTDSQNCVNHDVWISDDGRIAYNAYWDAGLVLLDITDPAAPAFIGQAQERVQLPGDPEGWLNEEGNTHSMVPVMKGGRHLVAIGDEDFTGGAAPGATINSPEELAGFLAAVQWEGSAPLSGQTGDFVYVGAGCHATDYLIAGGPPAVEGKIVLVDDRAAEAPFPECVTPYTFFQKANLAAENGAIGLVQVPDVDGEPTAGATAVSASIPALEVFRTEPTVAVRDAVVASSPVVNPAEPGPAVNSTLERAGEIDPWGFMRVLDLGAAGSVEQLDDPSQWREVAQFKAPHVEDPEPGEGNAFSAHNPILGPDGRIYFSWYTDGVRVLELQDAGRTVNERAWLVPLPGDREGDNDQDPRGIREDNAGFWGSWPLCHPDTGDLLVFNSDSNRGINILRARYADCREAGPAAGDRPAKLRIRRARVRNRRLKVRGSLARPAAGERVMLRFRARGREIRLRRKVDERGRFRTNRRLRGPQRRARGGRLIVRYAGNPRLRPARERLRAARKPVRLRFNRRAPRIAGDRLIVAGRVVRKARRNVRVRVEFNRADGSPAAITSRGKVNRRGRWRVRLEVPAAVRELGAHVSATHRGRGRFHGQRIGRNVGGA